MNIKKFDFSKICDLDDENPKNDCWHCTQSCFPIGCMVGERESEKESGFLGEGCESDQQ